MRPAGGDKIVEAAEAVPTKKARKLVVSAVRKCSSPLTDGAGKKVGRVLPRRGDRQESPKEAA
jgi:hypothetical protein